jgi:hypothetical protein
MIIKILNLPGVYGMWNIYIFGLLFLYAPSHKTWGNEDTHSTGQSFTRFLHSLVDQGLRIHNTAYGYGT